MNIQFLGSSEQCIGTKLVLAIPMTRGAYNTYQGWDIPDSENPDDEGYLIEYKDGGKPNHPHHSGYISWTPVDVFNAHYRRTNGEMTFGDSLLMLKAGKRVARLGWNGKGMFLALVKGSDADYHVNSRFFGTGIDGNSHQQLPILDAIYMKTADNKLVAWLASQTDMLADDWMCLDDVQALPPNDDKNTDNVTAEAQQTGFVPDCSEATFQVDDRVKCKNCGKSKYDRERMTHDHLMEKCNLLREIVSIPYSDRGSDPHRELKEAAATKLKTKIEEL
jgi:hypothetical protein